MADLLTGLRTTAPRRVPGGLGSAHCDVCKELLLDYITAGNDVVELQRKLASAGGGSAVTADGLKRAAARRNAGHQRLVRHQHEHLS
jgi:hypothetical protein